MIPVEDRTASGARASSKSKVTRLLAFNRVAHVHYRHVRRVEMRQHSPSEWYAKFATIFAMSLVKRQETQISD